MVESKKVNCKHHGWTEAVRRTDDGYWRCKVCRNYSTTNSRRNKKTKLVEIFGGCCQVCGYNLIKKCLQFHHRNRELKKFQISGNNYSFERLLREVLKCVLLCSRCHTEIEEGYRPCPPALVTLLMNKLYGSDSARVFTQNPEKLEAALKELAKSYYSEYTVKRRTA
jgi:hypothetical protein